MEALVASIVFLAGVMGVMSYLSFGRIALRIQERRRSAAMTAHSRLEELRTVAYSSLPSFAEEGAEVDVQGITGSRVTTIEDVDEDEDDTVDYRRATVTVSWQEYGRTEEVELVTLFAPLD